MGILDYIPIRQEDEPPLTILLLNAEDDLGDTIAPRLDKANADDTRIFAIEGISGSDSKGDWKRQFSLETDLPRLEEVLVDHPDTRLVIIDPIAAYLGGVDSHKNSDVRGQLAPLAELAGRHHVAVVTVTHLSKSGGTESCLPRHGLAGILRSLAIRVQPQRLERAL